MYHKHNTEGVVIGGWERGEASRDIAIFSREFGVIFALVQNGRSINSKLRYAVQDYSLGNFTLVKGKNSWKLVGAEVSKTLKNNLFVLANIFSLVRRLTGEQKNEELYNIVSESIKLFQEAKAEEIKRIESQTILKILKNLGYLEESEEEIINLSNDRRKAIEIINNSLLAADLGK